MTVRREGVALSFDAGAFTGRLRLMEAAVTTLGNEFAMCGATWEPHDWQDFS